MSGRFCCSLGDAVPLRGEGTTVSTSKSLCGAQSGHGWPPPTVERGPEWALLAPVSSVPSGLLSQPSPTHEGRESAAGVSHLGHTACLACRLLVTHPHGNGHGGSPL